MERIDQISIRDIELFARIGVTAEERAEPQRLLISVEMGLDLKRAGESDDLADTVDYAAVFEEVRQVGVQQEWNLIEALASAVADVVLSRSPVARVAVEIKKFILPQTRHVAVRIERERPGG